MQNKQTPSPTIESILKAMQTYNERCYPDQFIGVAATFTLFPDGSGYVSYFITDTILKEFNSVQELLDFLKGEEDDNDS